MQTKLVVALLAVGLAGICIINAQSPSPTESPSPGKKHRTHKKAGATASPAEKAASSSTAESPAASPSPGKRRSRKKAEATPAASPGAESTATASASPAEKRSRKKARTAARAAASPAASASPAKFTLGDLFKPKTSASASPEAANPAPAASTRAEAASNAMPAVGGGHGLVWVNTDSHVYHKEGSRFYGKTKKGKYVSEQEAIKEGDRAAANE